MADLERRSRGQLILVTGFILAVSFVALALVMNSVIYTENLATRSETSKASDGAQANNDLADGTGEIIAFANANNDSSYAALRENMTAGLDSMGDLSTRLRAASGQAVSVSLREQFNGTNISQTDNTRDFTAGNTSNSANWTLIDDIEDVERIELGITRMKDPGGLPILTTANFSFIAEDESGDQWILRLTNKTATLAGVSQPAHEYDIAVETPSNSYSLGTYPAESVINITNGSINGGAEPNMNLGEDIGPVDNITYKLGNHTAEGNYTILVQNTTDGDRDYKTANYNTGGASPFFERRIYNATVRVAYEQAKMRYETNVTRGPGG